MQTLLSSYFPYAPFRDLLAEVGGVIAGSAALAAYLTEHNVPSFVPADLDIWIRGAPRTNKQIGISVLWRVQNHLERQGYYLTHYHHDCDYASADVTEIISMAKGTHRLQLIGTVKNPVEYITESFDLSACITWWDPTTEEIETLYPADTQRKIIYLMHTSEEPRHHERVQKYVERGFRVLDAPPLHEIAMDPLEDLTALKGITAFDVVALEDVDAVEYVTASRWNILIRVGDTYYAYHREQLLEHLRDHSTHEIFGRVSTLPHRQAIMARGIAHLAQSDFTVYELKPVSTFEGHSLFSLFAFTAWGFAYGKHGASCHSPTEEMLAAYAYFNHD